VKRSTLLRLAYGAAGCAILPLDPGGIKSGSIPWELLQQRLGGRLLTIASPWTDCRRSPMGDPCATLFKNLENPYYIGGDPALTQTLGWMDAWTSEPSTFIAAVRDGRDVAAAIDFAREYGVRLAVKGGGHSYQGTSNAAGSLLIWTRDMNGVALHDAFVPNGCDITARPAVSLGAGVIWANAYDAVTTRGGRYVQGGGCTTVGVAGLIQSGGFGSFSKHYGLAAASLLEAEIVTADGRVRRVNECNDADLFWALKGGGGGSFGVITKVTLATHELPRFFGAASLTVKAASDEAYRELIAEFVEFYRRSLFNDRWGEQWHVGPHNVLTINMESCELADDAVRGTWRPFLDFVASRSTDYRLLSDAVLTSVPARSYWDATFIERDDPQSIVRDTGPGARTTEYWWQGDADQVGQYLYAFESLWLSASLLDDPARLADILFSASRHWSIGMHCNKGLAGASRDVRAAAANTAMNPVVLRSFALAICGAGQGPAYPNVVGRTPDFERGRSATARVRACMDELRTVVEERGSYISESDYFLDDWRTAYWGSNYERLAAVKRRYDPDSLFQIHHGVGSS
jgi:FAD/FMN-containing dehydrogenase